MDKEYWNKYYKDHECPFNPSPFSKFVMDYINERETLIDIGCGNGRDSIFFGMNNINVIGIDQCEPIIFQLSNCEHPNVKFISSDFTKLEPMFDINHVYSRFSLHSINEEEENSTIKWASSTVNGYFFIEVRSDHDSLLGKNTDHYRRFVNMETLLSKLIRNNFSIKYAELNRGFSKYDSKFGVDYNEDDPMLIRVVAAKTI